MSAQSLSAPVDGLETLPGGKGFQTGRRGMSFF
jgi:hypothetical protein